MRLSVSANPWRPIHNWQLDITIICGVVHQEPRDNDFGNCRPYQSARTLDPKNKEGFNNAVVLQAPRKYDLSLPILIQATKLDASKRCVYPRTYKLQRLAPANRAIVNARRPRRR